MLLESLLPTILRNVSLRPHPGKGRKNRSLEKHLQKSLQLWKKQLMRCWTKSFGRTLLRHPLIDPLKWTLSNFSLMPTRPLEQTCSNKVAWRRAPKLSILPTLSRPSWHMCFFVLRYRNNPFADSWLIFTHSEMRKIRDRKRAVLAHCRPWSTISHSEIDDVCLELLSLFEEAPKPESMNSGVFRTFAKALISAKLRVANHFKPGAKSYEVPGCNSKLYFFEVQSCPGPEPPGQAHLAWAHCSDVPGSVGILASGRVIRTAAWTLGLRPDQESMSFFGRCHTNIGWTESFIEWAANLNWSTKNSSGIVFGGYMGGNFAKSPSANTVLENSMCRLHQAVHSVSKDKRWAIRESAARIDYIFIVADQDSADFPARSMLNTVAHKISQRAIQDTEAWGGWRSS